MGLSSLNHGTNHKWSYETEGFQYKKCADMELGKIYTMRGCFITKDNGYGRGAVFTTDDCHVNVPQALVKTVEQINKTDAFIEQIEEGHAGFVISTYTNSKNKLCYDVKLVDID